MTCWTIDRLRALRPGERFIWYVGDLPMDIVHSAGAPQYAALLNQIRHEAKDLAEKGLITLSKRDVIKSRLDRRGNKTEYPDVQNLAIGKEPVAEAARRRMSISAFASNWRTDGLSQSVRSTTFSRSWKGGRHTVKPMVQP